MPKIMVEFNGKEYPVKFCHRRIKGDEKVIPRGGDTIAYIKLSDDANLETGENIVKGLANCSKKDVYNKKYGRMIALNRLQTAIAKKIRTLGGLHMFRTEFDKLKTV